MEYFNEMKGNSNWGYAYDIALVVIARDILNAHKRLNPFMQLQKTWMEIHKLRLNMHKVLLPRRRVLLRH